MTADRTWRDAVALLKANAKYGETLFVTVQRVLAERDAAALEATRGAKAVKEARDCRFAFAAACESQPDKRLKIFDDAMHGLNLNDELGSYKDLTNNSIVYYVIKKT